ncbi:MAG: hypothetical protein ABUL62_25190 [Myxococcales bacterium]
MIDARVAPSKPRWKVQLELAPAEIALVYRQGLARGAEVCRRGTHEWRPLVTTPELRTALVGRSSWPDIEHAVLKPPPVPSFPDSAVTQPLPTRTLPPPPVFPEPFAVHDSHSELPPAVTSVPPPAMPARHARSSELSLVAVLSFAATLGAALLAQHASHWTEVRAQIDSARPANAPTRPVFSGSVQPSVWSDSPAANAPVVTVHDLPLERGGALVAAPAPFKGTGRGVASPASGSSGGRNDFARAMAQAARAAQSCGEGPVHTQVVATFGASGVPSSVHFGSAPPPTALRSCVLSAVARSRVSPFEGDPVTVSKTLSW